jgi:hypothetical protein
MGLVVFLPVLAQLVCLGVLTYMVIRFARVQSNGARRMTDLAALVAVTGSLAMLLWPVGFSSYGSITISVDPATGATSQVTDSGVRTLLFPNLAQLGDRALLVAGIPVAATALAAIWQRILPLPRIARVGAAIVLGTWFVAGFSSFSWWSYPAILPIAVAISRREGTT